MRTREEERTGFKIFERVCLCRLVHQCFYGSFGPAVKCINQSRKSYVTFQENLDLECPAGTRLRVSQTLDGQNFHSTDLS